MKKILIALLVLVMICSFGLAGCGSSGSEETEDAAVTEEQEAVEETAEEVAEEAQDVQEEAVQEAEAVQKEESKAAAAPKTQTESKKASTSTQKAASSTQKTQTQAQAPAQQQTTTPEKKTGTKADAESYTGKNLSDFTAEYGQPNSSSYSDSCLGDGQDGEHHYNGYTVYTYTENGEEKIQGVE